MCNIKSRSVYYTNINWTIFINKIINVDVDRLVLITKISNSSHLPNPLSWT